MQEQNSPFCLGLAGRLIRLGAAERVCYSSPHVDATA
jgi:hypothetical protein